MFLLEYAVSRPIPVKRRWLVLIIILAIVFVVLTTLINIIAVGYELVSFTSTTFNETRTLWYERLIPVTSWLPRSRTCDGTVIKLMERLCPKLFPALRCLGVSNAGPLGYSYALRSYVDSRPGSPFEGLTYANSIMRNCSVQLLRLTQPYSATANADVCIMVTMEVLITVEGIMQYFGLAIYLSGQYQRRRRHSRIEPGASVSSRLYPDSH